MSGYKMLGCYQTHIMEIVGCSETEAIVVEEIMRCDVFHSTLDWQTVEEFEAGAREAYATLQEMRELGGVPESYQAILANRPPPSP